MQKTLYYREWDNNTTPSDHERKYPPPGKCFGPIKLQILWVGEGGVDPSGS